MDYTKYIIIGVTVGIASGALGIGGGVLMLPALIWLCGMQPAVAAGTSLAVLVPPLLFPAALEYYRRGNIDLTAALFIAVTFSFGAYAGAWLRHEHILPESILRLALGLVMMYAAFNMIVISDSEATKAAGGIVAAAVAWLAFVWLRLIGRRALAQPKLQDQIQRMNEQGRGGSDYHI